jgi:hypothetical protein
VSLARTGRSNPNLQLARREPVSVAWLFERVAEERVSARRLPQSQVTSGRGERLNENPRARARGTEQIWRSL